MVHVKHAALVRELVLGVGALPACLYVLLVAEQRAVGAEVLGHHLPLPGGSVDGLVGRKAKFNK